MGMVAPTEYKLRVLLADGDMGFDEKLITELKNLFRIDHVKSEAETLRMLYREMYDILLVDLNNSKSYLSSFQLVVYLKRLERFKNLVIIGLSSLKQEALQEHPAMKLLDEFLPKPVVKSSLVTAISRQKHYIYEPENCFT